jgi:hypothetical protein
MTNAKRQSLNNAVRHWLKEYRAAKAAGYKFGAARAWESALSCARKAPGYMVTYCGAYTPKANLIRVTKVSSRGTVYGRRIYKTRTTVGTVRQWTGPGDYNAPGDISESDWSTQTA